MSENRSTEAMEVIFKENFNKFVSDYYHRHLPTYRKKTASPGESFFEFYTNRRDELCDYVMEHFQESEFNIQGLSIEDLQSFRGDFDSAIDTMYEDMKEVTKSNYILWVQNYFGHVSKNSSGELLVTLATDSADLDLVRGRTDDDLRIWNEFNKSAFAGARNSSGGYSGYNEFHLREDQLDFLDDTIEEMRKLFLEKLNEQT